MSLAIRTASMNYKDPNTGNYVGINAVGNNITVVDSLTSTSTTDALSANQGKVLNEKFSPITFGSTSTTIDSVLSSEWSTSVPNDTLPHLVRVDAQYGSWYGYLSRYSDSYGSGVLTRYDGAVYNVYLNNGTVTIRTPSIRVANDYITTSGTTKTYTLPSSGGYKMYVFRRNSSYATYQGEYLIQAYSGGSSCVKAISASSALSSCTISNLTLSLTTAESYVDIEIYKVGW